jgi:hypothetical protein
MIAVVVGWLLAGEHITVQVLGGMAMILASVALIRAGGVRPRRGQVRKEWTGQGEIYQADGAGRHGDTAEKAQPPGRS